MFFAPDADIQALDPQVLESVLPQCSVPCSAVQAIRHKLRRSCRAQDKGVRLRQVCALIDILQDSMHLYIKCQYSNFASSPWMFISDANLMDLHSALQTPEFGNGFVRVHVHDNSPPKPNGGAAKKKVIRALPTMVLEERHVRQLAAEGHADCLYCLEEFQPGESITFMPCQGTHFGHTACSRKWLAEASTCPICRFALPQSAEKTTPAALAELCKGAEAEMERIRNVLPTELCAECDVDDTCLECEEQEADDVGVADEAPRIESLAAVPSVERAPSAGEPDRTLRNRLVCLFRAMRRVGAGYSRRWSGGSVHTVESRHVGVAARP
jgi:hypothetical protein